jgi:hypothetical protein
VIFEKLGQRCHKYLIGANLMRYKKAKNLKDNDFKRFYGVQPETFKLMCQEVQTVEGQKTAGRICDLSVQDQILLTLSY